jgi:hypothetical protein
VEVSEVCEVHVRCTWRSRWWSTRPWCSLQF